MRISEYSYELPGHLIAQEAPADRDSSRMLVVDRKNETFFDSRFENFPDLFAAGDLLVLNNTQVFPARIFGKTETGARVEVFLIGELETLTWQALARPAKRLKKGREIDFGEGFSAQVIDIEESGKVMLEFVADSDLFGLLDKYGRTPLPPYIKRQRESPDDRARYQTVFARKRGAIAAPTAGLHFTPRILDRLRMRGVRIVEITMHVGYGTFEPVRVEDLAQHKVDPEFAEISGETGNELNSAKKDGRRIIAVGTTTARTLEGTIRDDGSFGAFAGMAKLTITPGYRFRAMDALLTNFHLPRSSLLVLVSTFGGHELIMKAYEHAVAEQYRFYSYGDCMFIM